MYKNCTSVQFVPYFTSLQEADFGVT